MNHFLSVPFLKYFFLFIFTLTIFFILPTDAFAVTCTSAQSGNWNTSTTWGVSGCAGASGSGGNTPGASDTVVITSNHNVTVTANITASALTFDANSTGGIITVDSGIQLTVTNAITLTSSTSASTAATIQNGTGNGTITAGSVSVGTNITSGTNSLSSTMTSTINTFTISGALDILNSTGTGARKNDGILNLNAGTMSVTGTVQIENASSNGVSTLSMTNGAQTGTLNLANATPLSGNGTFSPNGTGSTVNYSGANQAIAVVAYRNLTLSGSGTATGAVTTVNSDLTLSGTVSWTPGAINIGGNLTLGSGCTLTSPASANFQVVGTSSISGLLASPNTAATRQFIGAVTVNSGGSITNAGNSSVEFRGGISNNSSSTVSFGTGTITFSTNNQSLGGSQNLTFGGNVQIFGAITVTNNNTATVSITGTLTGNNASSKWTQGTNSTFAYGNTTDMFASNGLLDASTNAPNTVSYNADGNQNVFNPNAGTASTYHHLNFGGTGANRTKTADFNMTVNGDLTIGGQSIFSGGTSRTHTFKGNWVTDTTAATSPYTFTTAGTINFNTPGTPAATSIGGTTTQTIAFNIVNFNNTSGTTLNENATFSGAVTIATNVTLTTGANATSVAPASTLTVTGTLTPNAATVISGAGTLTGAGTAQVSRNTSDAFLTQYTITNKTLDNLTVDYLGGASQTVSNTTYGNAGSGSLKVSGSISTGTNTATVAGVFNCTGTFTPSAGTITMNTGSSITNSGTLTFFNLTTANSASVSTSASFTVSNTFTIGTSSTFTHSGGTITLSATGTPLVVNGTYSGSGGATIDYTNTTSATVTGITYYNLGVGTNANTTATTFTLGGNTTVTNVLTVGNASSSVANDSLDASTRTLTLSGTNGDPFVVTAWGNLTESTSTVEYTGDNTGGNTTVQTETYHFLNLGGASSETYVPEGSVTVANDLTINANGILSGTQAVTVNDDLIVTGTLSGTQNVTVNGTPSGAGTVNLSGGTFEQLVAAAENFGQTSSSTNWTFNNLKFNNSSGTSKTVTVASGGTGQIIISGTLTLGDGGSSTVVLDNDTNDRTIDADGALTISTNGSFTSSASTPLTIAGSFSNSGTFTPSNGAVTFDGGSQTITGNTTFYDVAFTGSTARTVTFTAGSITSVSSGGSLVFNGAASQLLTLQSSAGSDWYLQVANDSSTDVGVSYVSVSRSNAGSYKTIVAYDGTNTNGGNNTNWLFTPAPTSSTLNGGLDIRGGTHFGN